ncbi:hypothetical protein A5789_00010 [Nocardia sp. 852002-51101_SCH5132738]|nr:hypothetical protein A5789_00010 [Nocardia sp. 852002-51101_SCH5132738]OBB46870.1 hypothetical protein A5748_24180 [Nocardia sp. 852002-51244_SCH5132740]OBF77190.1 hypothetical protein A9X06_24045 [Mycobacterium sp. 852002-51759_SCH5129042]
MRITAHLHNDSTDLALVTDRHHTYETVFGFHCEIDTKRFITLRTGRAAGIQPLWMLRNFATQLFTVLRASDLHVPIFSKASTQRWYLLTQPTTNARHRPWQSDPAFVIHGVKSVPGMRLSLPTPGRANRVWLNPPQQKGLAPFEDVEDIIRSVARRRP